MDNDYFNFIQEFSWLQTITIPMLGICAGMQFLGLLHGSEYTRCLEIGMIRIETVRSTPLLPSPPLPPSSTSSNSLPPHSCSSFEGYNLHRYSIIPSAELTILAQSEHSVQAFKHKDKPVFGVMFHPEVRNPEIIEIFISEYCT